ncbi:membrane protein [Terrihabitans soli]|uniref:Membrane protein n=1 Tax=Terrihabitans soli TaxID=708113 RepID=A0A6S6QK50_9HYPH|nr:membrane protein [Terrihabitans soli]
MHVSDVIVETLVRLLSGWHLVYLLIGVYVGLVMGVLPALGGSAGMAVLLPFVFGLDADLALPMMIGMMAVTPTADTFPSVLMGIPGSNSSQSTVLDGFPMSKRGEGARALSAAFMSSLIGGVIGAAFLTIAIFFALPFLLMIGFGEQLMLIFLALTMVGTLTGKSPLKGLATCALGLLVGTIGTAPATGSQRLTFDISYMIDGVPLVIVGLSLFALPEIVDLVRRQSKISETGQSLGSGWIQGVKDTFIHWSVVVRCSLLGVVIGALPGIGGSVINWVSYSHVVQTSKDKSQFGKGDVRGVIGPESANNAQDGGALIPTLLFGIPGSGSMALLLAGFILVGIEPGVEMITTNLDLTYTIIWSLALGSIFGAGTCVFLAKPIAKLTTVPATIIAPFMFSLIFLSAFQATRDWGDLTILILIAILGIYMKRFGWSRPAFMIGFVLSGQLENGLYRVTQVYGFSFLHRPVVIGLLVILALAIFAAVRFKDRGDPVEVLPAHAADNKTPQIIFIGVLIAAVAFALVDSIGWNFATALMPRSVSVVALVMLLPLLVAMLRTRKNAPFFYDSEREEFSDEVEYRTNEHYIGVLIAVLVGCWVFGFVAANTAFVYYFLWAKARVKQWQAALGAACLAGSLVFISYALGLKFPESLLSSYVDLPGWLQ